jgi:ribosome recycling factor
MMLFTFKKSSPIYFRSHHLTYKLFCRNYVFRSSYLSTNSCLSKNHLLERKKGGSEKSGAKGGKKQQEEDEVKEVDWSNYKELMKDSVSHYQLELSQLKLGRAQPSLIEVVDVPIQGQSLPLKALAQITVVDGNTLGVSVFDQNNNKPVTNALQDHEMGFTLVHHGRMILVTIPKATNEMKAKLAKMTHELAEQAKIQIRHIRRKLMDEIKEMNLPKDEDRNTTQKGQALHDEFIKVIDDNMKAKEKELKS